MGAHETIHIWYWESHKKGTKERERERKQSKERWIRSDARLL